MPSTLYHVTETSSGWSIQKNGIRQLYPSVWTTGTGKRYGEGEIFAFEKFADAMKWATHMEWELHKDLGTGKISIVEFIKEGKWEIDTNDPISQSGRKGHWLKKHGYVPAKNIVSIKPVTSAMVKKFIADSNKEYKTGTKKATNPPQIQIERVKDEDIKGLTYYEHVEDLFSDGSAAQVMTQAHTGRDGRGLRQVAIKEGEFAVWLHDVHPGWDISEEEFYMRAEATSQLIAAAVRDARTSGASMIYTRGPAEGFAASRNGKKWAKLLEQAGFKPTGIFQDAPKIGQEVYAINFREQATNHPPKAPPLEKPSCPDCEQLIGGLWRTGRCDECHGSGEDASGEPCVNCLGTGMPVCCRCEGTGIDPEKATNPPPHMISREYGGGPEPSSEDPHNRVTISIEQPEDITSEEIHGTKLDLFFSKIGYFIRGNPGICKAFGLPSPDPVYSDPRRDPDPKYNIVVALMFGITADPRLTSLRVTADQCSTDLKERAEELDEIMSELIKAAFDEAKLHGAYGVFTRGGFAEKHRMLIKNGFTETDATDMSGYRIYVKVLGDQDEVQ